MENIQPGTIKCLLEPQDFAYNTGVTLRGYSATRKGNDWQVIFRGSSRTGENVYCLYVAVDLGAAWEGLFAAVTGKGGSRYWYPDKYAK
jgi:hypothetical protein